MRQPVDISARIRGVKPRPATIELCTDPDFRDAIEQVIAELQTLKQDVGGGTLADGDGREELLAKLATLNEEAEAAGAWMRMVLHAPGHSARVGYMAALASMTDKPDEQRETLVSAEVALLMSSLKEIDGEPTDLSEADARYILTEWDDSITRELIDAISDFAPEAASVPFSRRVSAILTTLKP